MSIKIPQYSLLEKNNLGSQCDSCGRELKNVYVIRDNVSKETFHFGSGCAHNHMGKSVTEVYNENKEYDKAVKQAEREEEMEAMGRTFVQEFEEANPEMLAFIDEGSTGNNFLADMKAKIEESGTLTKGQYDAVFRMMLPFADLEKDAKIKDMIVYPSAVKIEEGQWGWSYTITAITEDDKKVRIFFSSLNEQKEGVLASASILRINNRGEYETSSIITKDNPILVSGSFDGYKLKRAKITRVK